MPLAHAVVLVTGANGGIGLAFAREAVLHALDALEAGAEEILADEVTVP